MTTMPEGATSLIRWNGVGLVYAGEVPVVGLHPTTLQIDPGSYVAVTGPSGSGKSTLLSILGLLSASTSGTYALGGRDLGRFTDEERATLRAQSIGFVFQSFHLVPSRTALDNVAVRLMYQGHSRRTALDMAAEALDRVGLHDRARHLPGQLSGGQSQRVAIARAIVGKPLLLLADEPTGNLDSETSAEILALIDDLRDSSITVVVVTHSRDVAARADARFEVCDGRVQC